MSQILKSGAELGVKGRNPATSTTCEENSNWIERLDKYVTCGQPAVATVYHARDGKSYAMCAGCVDHNVRNRGGALVEPYNPDIHKTSTESYPPDYDAIGQAMGQLMGGSKCTS